MGRLSVEEKQKRFLDKQTKNGNTEFASSSEKSIYVPQKTLKEIVYEKAIASHLPVKMDDSNVLMFRCEKMEQMDEIKKWICKQCDIKDTNRIPFSVGFTYPREGSCIIKTDEKPLSEELEELEEPNFSTEDENTNEDEYEQLSLF